MYCTLVSLSRVVYLGYRVNYCYILRSLPYELNSLYPNFNSDWFINK